MDDYKPSYAVAPAPQRLIPYSRNWYLAKIILRFVCFLFSAVTLGLATTAYRMGGVQTTVVFPPAICAMVWNFVELAVYLIRYKVRRGMHPGFSLAADLIMWLMCLLCAFFSIAISLRLVGGAFDPFTSYYYSSYGDVDLAITIILSILTIIHFTLFVRGCIETKQRNDSKSEDLYVYMYTPGGGPPIPVLSMKDQGGNRGMAAAIADEQRSDEAEIDWGVGGGAHSIMSPSVGITDRHTIISSFTGNGTGAHGNRPPSTVISMPAAPPSVYSGMGMGDGFSGYRGPTDELEAHMYHSNYGQKEIIPPENRRMSRTEK